MIKESTETKGKNATTIWIIKETVHKLSSVSFLASYLLSSTVKSIKVQSITEVYTRLTTTNKQIMP